MTEKEKMLLGKLYNASDAELQKELKRCRKLTRLFNNSTEEDIEYRSKLLKDLFGKVGENIFIEPTFRCDYGKNIYIGDNFVANYDCIILDVCKVEIGNNVMFGPNVSLMATNHPLIAHERVAMKYPDGHVSMSEYADEIHIGNNVWVAANVVILGGVTIGDNAVIGAGSVVTKDIPANYLAYGVPCKPIREITEQDSKIHLL